MTAGATYSALPTYVMEIFHSLDSSCSLATSHQKSQIRVSSNNICLLEVIFTNHIDEHITNYFTKDCNYQLSAHSVVPQELVVMEVYVCIRHKVTCARKVHCLCTLETRTHQHTSKYQTCFTPVTVIFTFIHLTTLMELQGSKPAIKTMNLRISSILWATKKSMTVRYGRNHRSIMHCTTCLWTRIIITCLLLIWCHLNITSWIQGQLRLITILLDIKSGLISFTILSTTIKWPKLHHHIPKGNERQTNLG